MAELSEPDVRCPNCGAAVYAGAEWCNLCFTRIEREAVEGASERSVTRPAPGSEETPAAESATDAAGAFWPCPVCEAKNPIELDVCAVCGTPFATVMRREEDRPHVDPAVAFGRSLVFPGLGHAKLGLSAEGFARGALFVILLLVTLLIALAGASSPVLRVLLLTFAIGTLGVYLVTAAEARKIAEGGRPIVSTRLLLWVTVGVLMAAMALIVVVIGTTPTQ
jgi:hypothetical protein